MKSQAGVFWKAVDLQINRQCSFISALAWLNMCSNNNNKYSASLTRRFGQNRIHTTKAEFHSD